MSRFAILPLEVLSDRSLSMSELRVLIALHSFKTTAETTCVWPSRAAIIERTRYSSRVVSTAITGLCAKGWVERKQAFRRPNQYRLMVPDQFKAVTPEVTVVDPATSEFVPKSDRRGSLLNSDPRGSPNCDPRRSLNSDPRGSHGRDQLRDVSKGASDAHARTGVDLELPSWLDPELWRGFLEHRRSIRAPMTEFAVELFLKHLIDQHGHGHDINAILKEAIRSGWKNPVFDKTTPHNGRAPKTPSPSARQLVIDQLDAQLTGLRASPTDDET